MIRLEGVQRIPGSDLVPIWRNPSGIRIRFFGSRVTSCSDWDPKNRITREAVSYPPQRVAPEARSDEDTETSPVRLYKTKQGWVAPEARSDEDTETRQQYVAVRRRGDVAPEARSDEDTET